MPRLLPALLALAAAQPALAGLRDYPFRLESVQNGSRHEIVARNDGYAPAAVQLSLSERDNVVSDVALPLLAVVPARESLRLATLSAATPGRGYRFSFKYRHTLGDPAARHDPQALYRLPFEEGRTFLVSQAHGGTMTTHKGEENAHAVDIVMPERTPIVAARAGVVIDIENFHVRGGKENELLDKANSVTILHEDGTMARYVHLVAGQYTWIGQEVQAGTHIGYSGNTGYSSGPHLHFVVVRAARRDDGGIGYESLPLTFYAHEPPVRFAPAQGMMVTSDYLGPGSLPPLIPLRREPAATGARR
jgi:murein DD-endopeptidase MepM/ murein hydrolase activator NlpD